MTDPQGDSVATQYAYNVKWPNGSENMHMVKDLNFITDSKIIKAKAQGYKFEGKVTSLKYQDGSEIKLLDRLP